MSRRAPEVKAASWTQHCLLSSREMEDIILYNTHTESRSSSHAEPVTLKLYATSPVSTELSIPASTKLLIITNKHSHKSFMNKIIKYQLTSICLVVTQKQLFVYSLSHAY